MVVVGGGGGGGGGWGGVWGCSKKNTILKSIFIQCNLIFYILSESASSHAASGKYCMG